MHQAADPHSGGKRQQDGRRSDRSEQWVPASRQLSRLADTHGTRGRDERSRSGQWVSASRQLSRLAGTYGTRGRGERSGSGQWVSASRQLSRLADTHGTRGRGERSGSGQWVSAPRHLSRLADTPWQGTAALPVERRGGHAAVRPQSLDAAARKTGTARCSTGGGAGRAA